MTATSPVKLKTSQFGAFAGISATIVAAPKIKAESNEMLESSEIFS
jgi:hypothetical protein